MTLVTKATRGAVGTNNWSSPGNATADDGVYATAAPGKNATTLGDWDFAAFSDVELPVGATINSVVLRAQYKVNTTASVAHLHVEAGNNGVFDAVEEEQTEPAADLDFDVTYNTAPTETDLKTAGRLVARIGAHRGNSNNAVTFSLDYVELRVDYTSTQTFPQSFAGGITPTGTGTKDTQKPLSGGVIPTGAPVKQAEKAAAGGITPTGSLVRELRRLLAGSITPGGALAVIKAVLRDFAGGITPTGSLNRTTDKPLGGGVTPTGTMGRQVAKLVGGAITPSAALTFTLARTLGGGIGPVGTIAVGALFPRTFGGQVTPTGTTTPVLLAPTVLGAGPLGVTVGLAGSVGSKNWPGLSVEITS